MTVLSSLQHIKYQMENINWNSARCFFFHFSNLFNKWIFFRVFFFVFFNQKTTYCLYLQPRKLLLQLPYKGSNYLHCLFFLSGSLFSSVWKLSGSCLLMPLPSVNHLIRKIILSLLFSFVGSANRLYFVILSIFGRIWFHMNVLCLPQFYWSTIMSKWA